MTTNAEYLKRWEESAPTPVDSGLTPEEIKKAQGTRACDKPRWENYMEDTEVLSPALQAEIEEYSKKHHDKTSAQNEEELARWKEHNAGIAEEYQFVKPDEYNNVEERKGVIMHSSDFIKKLQGAGVKCWYKAHPHADKMTLMVQKGLLAPEMGAWVQLGFMPELSIMNFDEHGIPLAEKMRGWRTVLLQLILKQVIAEDKANAVFGPPKTTPAFHRYNALLQSFRNAGNSLKEE
jgi:hypothetical protein